MIGNHQEERERDYGRFFNIRVSPFICFLIFDRPLCSTDTTYSHMTNPPVLINDIGHRQFSLILSHPYLPPDSRLFPLYTLSSGIPLFLYSPACIALRDSAHYERRISPHINSTLCIQTTSFHSSTLRTKLASILSSHPFLASTPHPPDDGRQRPHPPLI